MAVPTLEQLKSIFGDIDIYLFDQLLKGRIQKGMTVLDAGCGNGRNSIYLMKAGVDVYGVDSSEKAIQQIRESAVQISPDIPWQHFMVADLASLPHASAMFDVVICSAVLHFSKEEAHFRSMVQELVRVLKPGGMLFCRLSTTIGLKDKLNKVAEHKYQMSHGPVWFLADEDMLISLEKELKAVRMEPLKTVLVEQERTMTTWVLRK